MRVNSVVKEWSILLPDFVFLENALFFDLINVVNCARLNRKTYLLLKIAFNSII